MTPLRSVASRLRALFTSPRDDAGFSEYRDQRALPSVDTIARDIRYALRTFRRSPGFVVAVVLSLALGIGVNSAIFTVLNALMLRSLPVRNPQELFIALPQDAAGLPPAGPARSPLQFSYPMFERLRRSGPDPGTLAAISRIARMYRVVDGERETQTTAVQLVSGEFFPMLGVSPVRGRVLAPQDDQQVGGHPFAVISHGFWLRAFGGADDIVGRGITLNGTHFTVVGVGAQGFSGVWLESPVDLWVPLMMQSEVNYSQNFSNSGADKSKTFITQEGIRWLDVIGRETNSASIAALSTTFQQSVAQEAESISDPDRRRRFLQQRLAIEPFSQGFSNLRARFAAPLFALFGMTALILLIACANTANLLLARAAARQREIAVRLSVGASRSRLVGQLLTEDVLLVTMATAVGLLFAGWTGDLLVRRALGSTGAAPFSVDVNGYVLAFTIAAGLVTVLLFGLAPAFRTTSLDLSTALKVSSARGSSAGGTLQKFLVASQVALSLVLLVGAGLFVRSLQNYARVQLGFSQEQVLSVWINPLAVGYPPERLQQLYRDLVARVEAVPGVSSASVAVCGLATGCQNISGIAIDGYQPAPGEDLRLQENRISSNYFATTGMRLLEGRGFDNRDRENTPKVAIVNRAMARRFFPDRSAVGRRIGYGTVDTEIVGVVEDARVNRIQDPPRPMAFYPLAQMPVEAGALDVRAVGDPRSITAEVRRAVSEVDAGLPIDRVTMLADQVANGLRQERLVAGVTSVFGILALGLACVGLFGVMAYAVSGRTVEFGIRMALGAAPGAVQRMVLSDALRLVALGLALGAPLAVAVALSMRTLLFGVEPQDLATLIGACVVLTAAGMLAAYVPARRAAHVDPMVALRQE